MGIGYAVLNATLSIGASANITGDFNIHFLTEDNLTTESGTLKRGITLKNYETSTDNTTVYKFILKDGNSYSIEIECDWFVINGKRYDIVK